MNYRDLVRHALQAWREGHHAAAEQLFRDSTDAYKRAPSNDLDFALGHYGAFLLAQDRKEDTELVLDLAVDQGTERHAIWFDYLWLIADRQDLDKFKYSVQRMIASVPYHVDAMFILSAAGLPSAIASPSMQYEINPWFMLAYSRRTDRDGAISFVEVVVRWLIDRTAHVRQTTQDRWVAMGNLGRILENTDRVNDATTVWDDAFAEGSVDPATVLRLTMHLERSRDYERAIGIAREALHRGLPAEHEESLRKLESRCKARAAKRRDGRSRKRADVPAYSSRHASSSVEPAFQLRFGLPVRHVAPLGPAVRCLLGTKGSSSIVDVDPLSGAELRRVHHRLPLMDTRFEPGTGRGIGASGRVAAGRGATRLWFLDTDVRVVAESSVPDAVSGIALGPGQWYVGCRDGCLYAFGFDGKRHWTWTTPGSRDFDDPAFLRPSPYHVASRRSFAAVAWMANIWAVSSTGETLWHVALPARRDRLVRTVSIRDDERRRKTLEQLALLGDAEREGQLTVGSLVGKMKLEAHPEGVAVTMESLGDDWVSSLLVGSAGVIAGTKGGRLYVIDWSGNVTDCQRLGEENVLAALRRDGTMGSAWCGGTVRLFGKKDNRSVNVSATAPRGRSRALTMFGDDVVLSRGRDVKVVDSHGGLLWSAEFARTVTGVTTHRDTLVCAAGVLAAFRRHRR